jgi:catechol 2,3-dioxygenase-like lactoylglutathione lyase family enzyme
MRVRPQSKAVRFGGNGAVGRNNDRACYELWRSRGAEFITEPKEKYGETRCYIRDPDGYIIEVGQSKPDFTYG